MMIKDIAMRRLAPLALALTLAGPALAESPVVVELFTSQGCSSCPPADDLLGELAGRADVLALGWHVDYWDYIGWRDPFAQPEFTARQNAYADRLGLNMVYTPQMVVDGAAHATGSDRKAVETLIAAARRYDRPTLHVTAAEAGGWTVSLADAAAVDGARLLWIDYLPQATRDVRAGENRGRALTNHHIVRAVRTLAPWDGEAALFAADGDGDTLRHAAVLQAGDGRILAAARAPRDQLAVNAPMPARTTPQDGG